MRFSAYSVTALGAVVALSGCSLWPSRAEPSPPPPVLPATALYTPATDRSTPPTSKVQAATALPADLAQWWRQLDDPALTHLIEQALHAHASVRSAQASLRQARALRDVQQAKTLPSAQASASVQRSQSGNAEAVSNFRLGVDAAWEPDLWNQQHNTAKAAQAEADAASTTLADTQVSVAAEVALAYLQLRSDQVLQRIARANLSSQQETLQITQWRAQAGLTTSLEVEQARTAVEQTAAQLPALAASIAKASHSLAVLTGQPPQTLQHLQAQEGALPSLPEALVQDIPAQSLRQRPDVRTAEYKVSAALARLSAADAARYPGFSLSGSLGLNALSLAALGSGVPAVNTLLASVKVPLFDAGALDAQWRAQDAALEQSRIAYQSTVLTALKEVQDALVALAGDRQRLQRLHQAADAAANAALLAQQRFHSGVIDFQTVLQTQRTVLAAQENAASAQASLAQNHVRLYKALGGGWQTSP